MPLITLIIYLVLIGVAMWLINTYVPMAPAIKTILNVVVVVVVVLWLLGLLGVLDFRVGPAVPRLGR